MLERHSMCLWTIQHINCTSIIIYGVEVQILHSYQQKLENEMIQRNVMEDCRKLKVNHLLAIMMCINGFDEP